MLLWVLLAFLSAAVAIALLQPLLRPAGNAGVVGDGAQAVYRDQLAEIDAEQQRGLLGADEAEAARREIARRLIAADDVAGERSASDTKDTTGRPSSQARPGSVRLAIFATALVPVAAIAVYALSGAPGLPSQPLAARRQAPPVSADVQNLVKAVEARLKETPDDGRGWEVIAPVYLRLARYDDAASAYRQALKFNGDSAARLSGYAEALMLANQGRVPVEARRAFDRLLELEPRNVRARFWLAFAKEQDGKIVEAAADYAKLLTELPDDVPWRGMVEERHQATRSALAASAPGSSPVTASPAPAPGPSPADIEAAAKLDEAGRRQMIEAMVAGLAARLDKDGRDVAGWQRLIRAQSVLGRRDEALASLAKARSALASEPEALVALAELAKSLGLGS